MTDLTSITVILTILATAVMAATAAIQAARQDFDPFGATVLAIVTAIGGGTLRDLLIGSSPVFWLQDSTYLYTAIPIGLITYFIAKAYNAKVGQRLIILLYIDGIGLALFTLVGARVALSHDISAINAVILGCITGAAGGMFRDILCGLQPSILKQDLYATVSLIGGTIYVFGKDYIALTTVLIIAFFVMIILRSLVIYKNTHKAH
jgi:uncharacterized membrane protein YeiH